RGRSLQGYRLRKLQGLGHSLEVNRHFVVFIDGGDLGSGDGINIAHVKRSGFRHLTFPHRLFVSRPQGRESDMLLRLIALPSASAEFQSRRWRPESWIEF